MGGWRGIVGYPDLPPARMGVSIGDTLAATYGCMGALAALHHRSKTGEGQIVDSALYEAVLQVLETTVSAYSASGPKRRCPGSTQIGSTTGTERGGTYVLATGVGETQTQTKDVKRITRRHTK